MSDSKDSAWIACTISATCLSLKLDRQSLVMSFAICSARLCNLSHSVFDNYKSPNTGHDDSCDFIISTFLTAFLCFQPPKFLNESDERSATGLFLGIVLARHQVLDLQTKVAHRGNCQVLDGKCLLPEIPKSTELTRKKNCASRAR